MLENRSREYYLNGIEERTKQADELWKGLIECAYYKRMSSVFVVPISLLNNALMCFECGLYLSSVLTCRVAMESALYLATANENMHVRRQPYIASGIDEYIESYNSTKCAHLLMDLSLEGLINEAQEQKIIERETSRLIHILQEKGNIAAHYTQRTAKHFQKWIPKRASEVGIDKAVEEAGRKIVFDSDQTKQILEISIRIFTAIINGTNRSKVVN